MNYENLAGSSIESGAILVQIPDIQKQIDFFEKNFPNQGPVEAAKAMRETVKALFGQAYVVATINPTGFNSYLARNLERTSIIFRAMAAAFESVFSENERVKASTLLKEINSRIIKAKPYLEKAVKKSPKSGDKYAVELYKQGKITRKELSRKIQVPVSEIPQRDTDKEIETETVVVAEEAGGGLPAGAIAAGLGIAALFSLR